MTGSASHNARKGSAIWGQVQAGAGGQGGQGGAGRRQGDVVHVKDDRMMMVVIMIVIFAR